jgi:SAM-dependent methyltransferase
VRHGEYYNWYVSERLDAAVAELTTPLAGTLAVDLGCGGRPYRVHLAGFERSVGIDLPGMPDSGQEADIHGDAQAIPVADGVADLVLCTEVMEHVPRPQQMLADIHRVLSPGGALVLSVPFSWHIHDEPFDYWRFTEHGLRLVLEDAGFVVEELRAVNGMVGSSIAGQVYILLFALGRFRALGMPLMWLGQMFARLIHPFDRNHRATSNYVVRARKTL